MNYKVKASKIKSVVPQKVGKTLLWILIAVLLIRGMGSFFKADDTQQAKSLIENFMTSREYKSKVEFESAAFARSFAMEFVSFDVSDTEEYAEKLKAYVPSYLEVNLPFKPDMKAEALSADSLKVMWVSQNQVNVDVHVKVRYTWAINQEDDKTGNTANNTKTAVQDTYIRIPVSEKDGKYLVEDYPGFIPALDKANIEYHNYSGKDADSDVAKEIGDMLGNFFKTYYDGNTGEISYYLFDPTKQVKGLEKRFEFVKVNSVNVYKKNDPNRFFAIVNLTVKDSINGQAFPQKFHLETVKKEDRYYIDTFDVRVGNLDNIKN